MQFAENQQNNHFGWLAFCFFAQGCLLAPLTILAIVNNGNDMGLWLACILAFVLTEITNLAAMPTKITIPIFTLGVITDIIIVAICLLH
ncbi:hypothetical protein FLA_0767 [Filimonas lacunae]|nr:hypothetical protein FLA_0767 [Filimonas lacunae]